MVHFNTLQFPAPVVQKAALDAAYDAAALRARLRDQKKIRAVDHRALIRAETLAKRLSEAVKR